VLYIAVIGRPALIAGHTLVVVSKSNEGHKAADLDDRPKFFLLSSLSICSVDLTYDGKLGYGFTSADELEEVDIGPWDKP
jgi:hypothetical protein